MTKARILIADDHELVRVGLRRVLGANPDWEICAEAADGREAVELARAQRPDIAILDYSMPQLNGLEATRQIHQAVPDTEVLILTMNNSESLVREVLAAGARGFMLKSDAGHALVHAVESLLRHKPFFTEQVSELMLQGYLSPSGSARGPLTPRERQVVQLVAEGKSSKQISRLLDLSVKTVEAHRANILHKLGLNSVTELVRYAVRNKIIEA